MNACTRDEYVLPLQVKAAFMIPDVLALKPANEAKSATSVELGQLTDGAVAVPFRLRLVPALTGWRTVSVNLRLVPSNVTTVAYAPGPIPANGKRSFVANSAEELVLQVGWGVGVEGGSSTSTSTSSTSSTSTSTTSTSTSTSSTSQWVLLCITSTRCKSFAGRGGV